MYLFIYKKSLFSIRLASSDCRTGDKKKKMERGRSMSFDR